MSSTMRNGQTTTNGATTRSNSCAPIGLDILKTVTNPAWLQQPKQDMRLFKEIPCKDAYWKNGKARWRYDKRSAYLACASSVKCGVGNYEYRGQCARDAGVGLYHIAVDYPSIAGDLLGLDGWAWSPVLAMAEKMGARYTVIEAYVWPESHSVLASFYKAIKDLRCEDEQASKWLYKKTFGMLSHWPQRYNVDMGYLPRGYVYRPDWWNLLKAELKARMYYHAWQVWKNEGLWPVSMHVDELGYAERVHTLRIEDGIGAFREKEVN